jgi:glycosyltransferase involved in cell wall biosynthesis
LVIHPGSPLHAFRLVIVTHAFPRWPGDVAGSFLGRLADALGARGHGVTVVAPADRGHAGRHRVGAVEVVQVRYASPGRENLAYTGDMAGTARSPSGAWAFRSLVRALANAARDEARRTDAHLVHAFWWMPAGWAAVGGSRPAVVSLMGTDVTLMRTWPVHWLARRVLRRAARVTALSTFLADEARRLVRLPSLEIARVPVPVDVARFQRAAPARGGGGIVYLGRLSRQKRVDLLLEAVRHAGLDVPVTIIGDGPARAELEARARALTLSNVNFRGAVSDADVMDAMANADVAAFLSRGEGLGLAAAEALMLGIPVVATTDGGGVLDLVRDGAGACVVAPRVDAVADGLRRCLGNGDMRAAAARAGDALREQLGPESVARVLEPLYAGVI